MLTVVVMSDVGFLGNLIGLPELRELYVME